MTPDLAKLLGKTFNQLRSRIEALALLLTNFLASASEVVAFESGSEISTLDLLWAFNSVYGIFVTRILSKLQQLHEEITQLAGKAKGEVSAELGRMRWADEVEAWSNVMNSAWMMLGGSVAMRRLQ